MLISKTKKNANQGNKISSNTLKLQRETYEKPYKGMCLDVERTKIDLLV